MSVEERIYSVQFVLYCFCEWRGRLLELRCDCFLAVEILDDDIWCLGRSLLNCGFLRSSRSSRSSLALCGMFCAGIVARRSSRSFALAPGGFFAAVSGSAIPCVSAGTLLPIVSGGDGSSLLGEGGELGGIFASPVSSNDSRCCVSWSFEGAFGEPVRADRFFGGMLCDLLDLVGMIAALCEMRELRDGCGVSMD